jgi:predicted AlkP superfamily phosphohydrolase/phosphomutase
MSFATGKNPGKHGIFDFSKRLPDSYESRPTISLDRRTQTLWDIFGAEGDRSIVINVPLTYPPTSLRGDMITGFPTPTEKEDYTYPRELLAQLKSRFGPINVHKPKILFRRGREQEITDETIRITKQQTEITKYLMQSEDWKFTLSVFDGPDIIGHYFWAYLDANHPKYVPEMADQVKQMVEDIHVELDRSIGELLAVAGPDALKLVISDHGFGPVYYGVYVNNWLLEQKYMPDISRTSTACMSTTSSGSRRGFAS